MPYIRLFIIGLVAVCMVGVWLYLDRTSAGRRTRAVMQNREVAGALGVVTPRVDMLTFGLASGLAGVAGCALALIGPIGPSLGTYYIVDAFLVVILGGVGQIIGTVVAALSHRLAERDPRVPDDRIARRRSSSSCSSSRSCSGARRAWSPAGRRVGAA